MRNHPPADVVITERTIRRLLRQCPQYAGLPLRQAGHGWDNEIWRLGDELAVRLPRRAEGDALLRNETRWLGLLAPMLPVPIPAPLFAGEPTAGYPYSWAVTPWYSGEPASSRPPEQRDCYAAELAGLLRALHRTAVAEAPINPVRGGPLSERVGPASARLELHPDGRRLRAVLDEAAAAPAYDGDPVWLHGDPHPYNMLVDQGGALSALIDFGDLGRGDPASDLGVAWLHFTAAGRERFFAAYGLTDDLLRRARGWAVVYASFMTMLDHAHPLRACGDHAVTGVLDGCTTERPGRRRQTTRYRGSSS